MRFPMVLGLTVWMIGSACNGPIGYGSAAYETLRVDYESETTESELAPTLARRRLARFCTTRADEVRDQAESHWTQDNILLYLAIGATGIGAALNGIVAVLPAEQLNSDERAALAGTGAGLLGAGAMFFTVRASVDLDGMQRRGRLAAADFALAGSRMWEDLGGDGEFTPAQEERFRTATLDCISAERSISEAYGTGDAESLQALIVELRRAPTSPATPVPAPPDSPGPADEPSVGGEAMDSPNDE